MMGQTSDKPGVAGRDVAYHQREAPIQACSGDASSKSSLPSSCNTPLITLVYGWVEAHPQTRLPASTGRLSSGSLVLHRCCWHAVAGRPVNYPVLFMPLAGCWALPYACTEHQYTSGKYRPASWLASTPAQHGSSSGRPIPTSRFRASPHSMFNFSLALRQYSM